jgi:hypothetical protein
MKTILLISFLLMLKFAAASNLVSSPLRDSSIRHKEHKLNEKEFLEKYGRDDSSRALISFYFLKRSKGITRFSIAAPSTVLPGIALVPVANKAEGDKGNMHDASAAGGLTILLCGAIAFLSLATAVWVRYSRKKLLRVLTDYSIGKHIPKGIAKNMVFKGFLHNGKQPG